MRKLCAKKQQKSQPLAPTFPHSVLSDIDVIKADIGVIFIY